MQDDTKDGIAKTITGVIRFVLDPQGACAPPKAYSVFVEENRQHDFDVRIIENVEGSRVNLRNEVIFGMLLGHGKMHLRGQLGCTELRGTLAVSDIPNFFDSLSDDKLRSLALEACETLAGDRKIPKRSELDPKPLKFDERLLVAVCELEKLISGIPTSTAVDGVGVKAAQEAVANVRKPL